MCSCGSRSSFSDVWQWLWQQALEAAATQADTDTLPNNSSPLLSPVADNFNANLLALTLLQGACLDFCIKLLNQQMKLDEYECLMVGVLAVLGCHKCGWCWTNSYLSLLSKVIKIACFLVMLKVLLLDLAACEIVWW
ncbi:hypothetical protein VTN02DRAFT_6787 [Thermoascus thermophilus]